MKDVMILTGAGQIGMAIARRMGYGKKIVIGDKKKENALAICTVMNEAGFDAVPVETDISLRESIVNLIHEAQKYGDISMLVNAAGVSPSQAPVETVLKVDLYGTAVLLEEVGKVIKEGGVGVTISSQSGHRMPALSVEIDEQLATTPAEELLALEVLQPLPHSAAGSAAPTHGAKPAGEDHKLDLPPPLRERTARSDHVLQHKTLMDSVARVRGAKGRGRGAGGRNGGWGRRGRKTGGGRGRDPRGREDGAGKTPGEAGARRGTVHPAGGAGKGAGFRGEIRREGFGRRRNLRPGGRKGVRRRSVTVG